jgi:hypothetical protein
MAQVCNPHYSEGRDQEDHGSKPAQENSSARTDLEKTFTKLRLVEWLKVKGPEFKPQYSKIKIVDLQLELVACACNPSTMEAK